MQQNTLGVVLAYYRSKYRFSQEMVCAGVCSVPTYHRVEQGAREIDSLAGEMLLGRVGREITRFEMMLNDEDYMRWQCREEIVRHIKEGSYKVAEEKVDRYLHMITSDMHLHRQFCLYQQALVYAARGVREPDIYQKLLEAIRCTKPWFPAHIEGQETYAPAEIDMIIQLIQCDFWKKKSDAEDVLLELLDYVKQFYAMPLQRKIGIDLSLELVALAQSMGDDAKVISYVNQGITFLTQESKLSQVAELHFIKARTLWNMYHAGNEWNERKVECKQECLMSFFTFELLEQMEQLEEVKQFCEEILQWQITNQEILFD